AAIRAFPDSADGGEVDGLIAGAAGVDGDVVDAAGDANGAGDKRRGPDLRPRRAAQGSAPRPGAPEARETTRMRPDLHGPQMVDAFVPEVRPQLAVRIRPRSLQRPFGVLTKLDFEFQPPRALAPLVLRFLFHG